ncbi:MAG: hypothetical protein JRF57_12855 [Deltaproteobacteria bacterium]|nr:hypothetical protein [Deltaproteobacteria bacterium]
MKEYKVEAGWRERSLRYKLAFVVSLLWTLYTLSHLCNLFFYLNLVIPPLTHRAISAGLICIHAGISPSMATPW